MRILTTLAICLLFATAVFANTVFDLAPIMTMSKDKLQLPAQAKVCGDYFFTLAFTGGSTMLALGDKGPDNEPNFTMTRISNVMVLIDDQQKTPTAEIVVSDDKVRYLVRLTRDVYKKSPCLPKPISE